MSTNGNDQGRAYEYAWINMLYQTLRMKRKTRIVKNSSLAANLRAWSVMSAELQALFERSAHSALAALLALEPRMTENAEDELLLEFQKDNAGIAGDVRDILVKREAIGWEVGLSIKHNHDAVKHSRLSHGLDFGSEWFGLPCSETYWNAVRPIFDMLKAEKSRGTNWSALAQKEETVYLPLLQAFMDEINNAYRRDPSMPKKMVEYLIGTNDYYKIISHDEKRLTAVHTFNTHGTLNKPGNTSASATGVPTVALPTELVALKFKARSTNTVEMQLNNDWQLSFRILNASTQVEPSLKFDVQFIKTPASILHLECKWQ